MCMFASFTYRLGTAGVAAAAAACAGIAEVAWFGRIIAALLLTGTLTAPHRCCLQLALRHFKTILQQVLFVPLLLVRLLLGHLQDSIQGISSGKS